MVRSRPHPETRHNRPAMPQEYSRFNPRVDTAATAETGRGEERGAS